MTGYSESAGLNRHVVGMKEPYRKENSDSILASSLAREIARCLVKRKPKYQWAGLVSFENPIDQDADFVNVDKHADCGVGPKTRG